jgi:hypothetical protein
MRDYKVIVLSTGELIRAPDSGLVFGRTGEKNPTRLTADISAWTEVYPDSSYGLILHRNDGLSWPILSGAVPVEGKIFEVLQPQALEVGGYSVLEVRAETATGLMKSATMSVHVETAPTTGVIPPQPTPTWIDILSNVSTLLSEQILAAQGLLPEMNSIAEQVTLDKNAVSEDKTIVAGYKVSALQSSELAAGSATEAGEQAELAKSNILNGVSVHNESVVAHDDIREDVRRVEAIARGRATAVIFDTLSHMQSWLIGEYIHPEGSVVSDLIKGDNLYILDTSVPDYWWDGTSAQELESESPDLTNYYTKSQTDGMMSITLSRAEYEALASPEAGRIYNVYD